MISIYTTFMVTNGTTGQDILVSIKPFDIDTNIVDTYDQQQRMLIEIILFASAGLVFCQIDLGTTPNIAPPSSLKFPVSIGYIFIKHKDAEN